ncbi:hypothetical protein N657DRAFT_646743 [Parathielavia appendiculata]|uniref:N-acetyltransferase domain-containing protein n=1 Tax=Parathielavia appendiculata TaxID=2587402 RepID=A0AAN6TWT0_9PEZI|nr:hypothetical protein N657DRAFT_646743 [Parathielavia appendiculata]
MLFAIRPGRQADVTLCGAIAQAAFAPSPLIENISPATEDLALAFCSGVAQSALDNPNAHLVVAEDTSQSGSSPPVLVGFAKWVFVPERGELPSLLASAAEAGTARGAGVEDDNAEGEKGQNLWETVTNAELAKEYFGRQHERHERYMGSRRHWYLELIATQREVKGLGAGRRLVQCGLDKVDEDGCEAYLEASPEGKGLFERFGFRVVKKLEYADGAYVECCMIRDGKKGI